MTAGAGVLATAGDGFTVLVVVADFMAAPGAAAAVVVALEATLFVVCGTAALTGGADVPAYIALPCCAAGAQGALAAADAAGAAAFFLKSDPKLMIGLGVGGLVVILAMVFGIRQMMRKPAPAQ